MSFSRPCPRQMRKLCSCRPFQVSRRRGVFVIRSRGMTQGLKPALIFVVTAALLAAILLLMGRNLICPCGHVALWAGPGVPPEEGSQHLFDLYAPSHVIHGLAFYSVLALLAPRVHVNGRLAVALV